MSYHIMSYHIISINQSSEYSVYHIHHKEVLHRRISYDRRRKNGQEKLNLNGRTKRSFLVFKKEEDCKKNAHNYCVESSFSTSIRRIKSVSPLFLKIKFVYRKE